MNWRRSVATKVLIIVHVWAIAMVFVFYGALSYKPSTHDDHRIQCLGWKTTGTCGKEPKQDVYDACQDNIHLPLEGYCQVRSLTTGQIHQLMRTTCTSTKNVKYSCRDAQAFMGFAPLSEQYIQKPVAPVFLLPWYQGELASSNTRGIVMVIQGKTLVSTYANVRSLRALGCTLPIELWFRKDELVLDDPILKRLLAQDPFITLREIKHPKARSFYTKPFAVYYSDFDHVLLLDTDNFAVVNPSYLFDTPEYMNMGALFWPDFWQPDNTIFNVHNESLLWELLGMPFVDMFEQESGQVLIHRSRHKKALDMLMFYAIERPKIFTDLELVWGDKDLFRLAWIKTQSTFYMIQYPPGSLGVNHHQFNRFCGLSMVQFDATGTEIFFHRNTIKFTRNATTNNQRQWIYLQKYHPNGNPRSYKPKSWNGFEQYGYSSCFGVELYTHHRLDDGTIAFSVEIMSQFRFANLESNLLKYAQAATEFK
ncbi:hypothetical protein THRCLA_06518 [Thraustotheca clavata]|uniref:Uncharacterized protein n=1 Tax=Thraustotheca clavata TaxID=74557 RepID=A0A1V9ZN81_9STRA|nr:hypothetical protein THRCLA_06518 [Thraustotheca clavata]